MIKLCIFDLDGTTVNSLRSIAYFANETLKRFGYPPFNEDAYRHLAGGGANALWNNICREANVPMDKHDDMMHDWLRTYEADFLYLTEGYEGVSDMLRAEGGGHSYGDRHQQGESHCRKIVQRLLWR